MAKKIWVIDEDDAHRILKTADPPKPPETAREGEGGREEPKVAKEGPRIPAPIFRAARPDPSIPSVTGDREPVSGAPAQATGTVTPASPPPTTALCWAWTGLELTRWFLAMVITTTPAACVRS